MEGQKLIYTPFWVRALALSALAIALLVSIYVVFLYIETEKDSWVLAALSVTQVATSGLVVALLLLFSSRDLGIAGLMAKADRFLCQTLPLGLSFIDVPQPEMVDWRSAGTGHGTCRKNARASATGISVSHASGDAAALYRIETAQSVLMLRVQVNVFEITVSYYFPVPEEEGFDGLKQQLSWAMSRFTEIGGYHDSWYRSIEAFDQREYVSVHLSRRFVESFLDDDREQLFFVQDLAASTRSLVKECRSKGIRLSY